MKNEFASLTKEKQAEIEKLLDDIEAGGQPEMSPEWRKIYAPKSPLEELHPLFCEALKNMDFTDWALDILTVGTAEQKSDFIAEFAKGVLALEKRIRGLDERKAG